MCWKLLMICLFACSPLFAQEENSYDLLATEVVLTAEENGYRSFKYAITNNGPDTAPAGSYRIFLKVNGKMISFDTKTSAMEAGKTLVYTSGEKFLANQPGKKLKYRLIIATKDRNRRNNKLKGEIML